MEEQSVALWKVIIVITGVTLVALVSGTPNSSIFPLGMIEQNFDLTPDEKTTFSTLGFIGVYFTLPAGILLDKFGPLALTILSGVAVSASYMIMSFLESSQYALMVILFILVGFGSGATFLCALGTAIKLSKNGDGPGVAIVAAAMSLSVAFTLTLSNTLLPSLDINGTNCTADDNGEYLSDCWRGVFRIWSVETGVGMIVGGIPLVLLLLSKSRKHTESLLNEFYRPVIRKTFHYYLKQIGLDIFTHYYFYILLIVYFVGVSSGILVLVSTDDIWKEYIAGDPDLKPNMAGTFVTAFSFFNAGTGLIGGTLSTFLNNKKILTHYGFYGIVLVIGAIDYLALGYLMLLARTHSFYMGWTYGILLSVQGITFGTTMFIIPVLTANIYGFKDFGKYFAWVQVGSSAAALLYPRVITATSDVTYAPILAATGGLCFIGAMLTCCAPRRKFINRETWESDLINN